MRTLLACIKIHKALISSFIVSLFLIKPISSNAQSDSSILVKLFNSTNGRNWIRNDHWLEKGVSIENWYGITTHPIGRVTSIVLSNNNLVGTIPDSDSLGFLPGLTTLNLANDTISGPIPPTLSNLANLQVLNLANNKFSGSIPSSFGNLSNLTSLTLNFNGLSGVIPPSLGNLTKLTVLDIWVNGFNGSLPPEIGKLTNLTSLFISYDGLSDTIPDLSNLTKLQSFILNNNSFTGSVPTWLNKLTNLSTIALNNNKLNGTIPFVLDNLTQLRGLQLSNNQLSGSLPATVLKLLSLAPPPVGSSDDRNPITGVDDYPGLGLGGNKFTFDGLEPIVQKFSFATYSQQDSIPIINNNNKLSVSAGGTLANNTYSWFQNGTLVKTITGDSTYLPTAAGNYYVKVTNKIANTLTLVSKIIAAVATCNPNFSITVSNGPACPSNAYTLVASNISNGGTNPSYAWLKNGVSQNNNTSSYYGKNLLQGDTVKCILTSTASCAGNQSDTVSYIVNYLSNLITKLTISPSDTITPGVTTYTFTETVVNPNKIQYTYSFYVNNKMVGSATPQTNSSNSFSLTTPSPGDSIYCTTTIGFAGNTCGSVDTSNVIRMIAGPNPDSLVLVKLYKTTGGDNWTNHKNWLITGMPINTWNGIDTVNGRVTNVNLYGNNLSGNIPDTLGYLPYLTTLILTSNYLTGSIPASLGRLTNLETLELNSNAGLAGTLPDSLSFLTKLKTFWLGSDGISGNIPTWLGSFANLTSLDFSFNTFSGTLPTELSSLTKLQLFSVPGNNLISPIPTALANWPAAQLTKLWLQHNDFVFDGGLEALSLKYSVLLDSPQAIVSLHQLTSTSPYTVTCLSFSGANDNAKNNITVTWYKISNGQKDSIVNNAGDTTSHFASLINGDLIFAKIISSVSKGLILYSDTITVQTTTTTNPTQNPDSLILVSLYNHMGGTVWANQKKWKQAGNLIGTWDGVTTDANGRVMYLNLSSNNLTGNIFDSICYLPKLQSLNLQYNGGLTGKIPDSIGNLLSLKSLILTNNSSGGTNPKPTLGLTGNIPASLCNLINLDTLALNYNTLSGNLPDSMGKLINLKYLTLGHNDSLTGKITVLGKLTNLFHCELFYNKFVSPIPISLGNLDASKVENFNINYNHFVFDGGLAAAVKNYTNPGTQKNNFNYSPQATVPLNIGSNNYSVTCVDSSGPGDNAKSNITVVWHRFNKTRNDSVTNQNGDTTITSAAFTQVTQVPLSIGDSLYAIITSSVSKALTLYSNTIAITNMSLPNLPTITSFTPTSGCAAVTTVLITGTNFTGTTAVTFGGTAAKSFTVISPTQINVTPASGISGIITVTTAQGSATSSGIFTFNAPNVPLVKISANPISPTCAGSNVIFTAHPTYGGNAPVYKWVENGNIVGTTDSIVSLSGSNIYQGAKIYCNMTSSDSCTTGTTIDSFTIITIVSPSISITSNPNGAICKGQSVLFAANAMPSAGAHYTWLLKGKQVGTDSINYTDFSPNDKDDIVCRFNNTSACPGDTNVSSAPIILTVTNSTAITANITSNINGTVCTGQGVTFTATPATGVQYAWYLNTNPNPVGTNSIYTNPSPKDKDSVYCIVTSTSTCASTPTSKSNVIIIAVGNPQPSITIFQKSPTGTVCQGTSITFVISAVKDSGSSPSYLWMINGAAAPGVNNTSSYTSSAFTNGQQVSCMLTSSLLCTAPVPSNLIPVSLTTIPTLNVTISSKPGLTNICTGSKVTFTATPSFPITSLSYQWTKKGVPVGSDQSTYTDSALLSGDTISCTIMGNSSCLTTIKATYSVPITSLGTLVVDAGPDKSVLAGKSVTLDGKVILDGKEATTQSDGILANWAQFGSQSGTLTLTATLLSPIVQPIMTSAYQLSVVGKNGCQAFDTVTVKVIPAVIAPNIFTPNNDGYHDTWLIPTLSDYPNCTVDVFDRDGHKIFSSVNYHTPWDGTYNGKPVPIGTYYYIINLKNDTPPIGGSVTIIR